MGNNGQYWTAAYIPDFIHFFNSDPLIPMFALFKLKIII